MQFTKMHGCGNDYIYVDGTKENIPDGKKEALVRRLSDRHFGIGGDGVIFINPVTVKTRGGASVQGADFEMEMYNADGSYGKMCGNGIRCVAKYVYDRKLTRKTKDLQVVSAGVIHSLDLTTGADGLVETVRVDMGAPVLETDKVPAALPSNRSLLIQGGIVQELDPSVADPQQEHAVPALVDAPFEIEGKSFPITCVSMGNPHAVTFLKSAEDLRNFPINSLGPLFEKNKAFPERVNTEFVYVDDRKNVHMRVFERGSGETLACGTGCCAVCAAGVLTGRTDHSVTVHVLGGDILCEWDPASGHIFMTGPATEVFTGTVDL